MLVQGYEVLDATRSGSVPKNPPLPSSPPSHYQDIGDYAFEAILKNNFKDIFENIVKNICEDVFESVIESIVETPRSSTRRRGT